MISSALAVFVTATLLVTTSVSTTVNEADRRIFEDVFKMKRLEKGMTYEAELRVLREAQRVVTKIAPFGDPIAEYSEREPADLVRHGTGACYDRSRTYDKLFKWMGFETRHVFLLYKTNTAHSAGEERSLLQAFFTNRQPSHAVTEVKTSHGWVLIDSNSKWIAVDRQDRPVPATELWRSRDRFDSVPQYMLDPCWAIRGMYSRKGQLYKHANHYVPFPEFNVPDLAHWIISG